MYSNNLEIYLIVIFAVFSIIIYFAPTLIITRKRFLMFIINLFIGFTGIGWGVCLWWACYTQFERSYKFRIKKGDPPNASFTTP